MAESSADDARERLPLERESQISLGTPRIHSGTGKLAVPGDTNGLSFRLSVGHAGEMGPWYTGKWNMEQNMYGLTMF